MSIMGDDHYDKLVEAIYDAALNPERWGEVVAGLKDEFDSIAAGFFVQTANQQLEGYFFQGIDNDEIERYGERFASHNPWLTVPGLMRPGRVLTDLSLEKIHGDRRAFLSTDMYQEWCKKQDFRHAMGGSLVDQNGNLLNFTFFRPAQAGYYTDAEIHRYRALCRHLTKAVEINAKIAALTSSQKEALDCLRLGVVTLDGAGRIAFANRYATALLDEQCGLSEKNSRLKAQNHQAQKRLDSAIDQALKEGKNTMLTLPRPDAMALSLSLIATPDKRDFFGMPNRTLTLFICDPDDKEVADVDCIAKRWLLSPREAQFAAQLLKGLSIKDVAVVLGLTDNTAQWYCKQIMQKLGVKRQSELVLKLMRDLSAIVHS